MRLYLFGIILIAAGITSLTGQGSCTDQGFLNPEGQDYDDGDNRYSWGDCREGYEENEDGICCHSFDPVWGSILFLFGSVLIFYQISTDFPWDKH